MLFQSHCTRLLAHTLGTLPVFLFMYCNSNQRETFCSPLNCIRQCCPFSPFKTLSLFAGDNLDAIHDITVAYPKNIPQTERHLILGLFPREIHFHVRRYPVASLPTSSSDLEAWCRERWAEKEARLRDFYSSQPRAFDREGVARVPPCKSELRVTLIKVASLLYWSSFIALCFTGLWLWAPFRLYFLVTVGLYVAQQKLVGGLELLELACHRYWKSTANNVREKNKVVDGKMK